MKRHQAVGIGAALSIVVAATTADLRAQTAARLSSPPAGLASAPGPFGTRDAAPRERSWQTDVGIDYMFVSETFLHPNPSYYSFHTREAFNLLGFTGELLRPLSVSDRLNVSAGVALTGAAGTYKGSSTVGSFTPGYTEVVSGAAAFGVRLGVFSDVSTPISPQVAAVGRLGIGATQLWGSSSGTDAPYKDGINEGMSDLTLALGARLAATSKLRLSLLVELAPTANTWAGYKATAWSPRSAGYSTWTFQMRASFRAGGRQASRAS